MSTEQTINLMAQAATFLTHIDEAFTDKVFPLDKQVELLTAMCEQCEGADVDSIYSNKHVAEGLAMRLHDAKMALRYGDDVWHEGIDCHGNDGLFEDYEQSLGE